MNDKTSSKLIKMLKIHEGVESHAYKCSESKITIGVGRNIDPEGGIGLTDDEVDYLLQNDIDRVYKELDFEYGWFSDLDLIRKEAMIDISFNLGQTRLRKFQKALTAMEKGDWDRAADEFMDSKWSKQVGNRAKTLTEMIRTGRYIE
jgi:lysozyme|tara:strand:+ start:548 stop:988 length:441 start_codon:yes stop_codon:yes gene_type:complete